MFLSVKSECEACTRDEPVGRCKGVIVHSRRGPDRHIIGGHYPCKNWDDECRHAAEPLGFYTFALLPTKCRNGKWRWLCSIEDHGDGTYTRGNRAF